MTRIREEGPANIAYSPPFLANGLRTCLRCSSATRETLKDAGVNVPEVLAT
jgi:hypothetical protein